jgi:hypothetical protein
MTTYLELQERAIAYSEKYNKWENDLLFAACDLRDVLTERLGYNPETLAEQFSSNQNLIKKGITLEKLFDDKYENEDMRLWGGDFKRFIDDNG